MVPGVRLALATIAAVGAAGACAGAGSNASGAQPATISGEIRRVDNSALLAGVTVIATCPRVKGTRQTVARDGRFTLTGLPAGVYEVRAYWGDTVHTVVELDLSPGEARSLAIAFDTEAGADHHGYDYLNLDADRSK